MTPAECTPGLPVTWWYEQRGGYGSVTPVPAIVVRRYRSLVGIAALTKRGEWVPRKVKAEKLSAYEREGSDIDQKRKRRIERKKGYEKVT